MPWLIVILSSYFLLAAVHLVDKYVLQERIPSAKVYAFYISVSGIFILAIAPFGFLAVPKIADIVLALLAGVFNILAVYVLFVGLKNFETSRIIPAVGASLPLFTFGFSLVQNGESLTIQNILAFILLVIGAFLITWERKKNFSLKSLEIAVLAAFLFAIYFILIKFVYLNQPFVSGLIWTRIGAFLPAIFLLFFKEVRMDIFHGPGITKKGNWMIILPNQVAGGLAGLLQNWAVAIVPFVYLGIINALEGVKYVFLLIFAALLSLKFPKILMEEISREIILQKVVAILFIAGGLLVLTLNI